MISVAIFIVNLPNFEKMQYANKIINIHYHYEFDDDFVIFFCPWI